MADEGMDGTATTTVRRSSKKKKSPGRTKISKHPFRASSAMASEEQGDSSINEAEGSGTMWDKARKQKELPKPAIIITMHHPWGFKNQQFLRKVRRTDEAGITFVFVGYKLYIRCKQCHFVQIRCICLLAIQTGR